MAKAERDGERSLTELILSKAEGFEMTEEKREMTGRMATPDFPFLSFRARSEKSFFIGNTD